MTKFSVLVFNFMEIAFLLSREKQKGAAVAEKSNFRKHQPAIFSLQKIQLGKEMACLVTFMQRVINFTLFLAALFSPIGGKL